MGKITRDELGEGLNQELDKVKLDLAEMANINGDAIELSPNGINIINGEHLVNDVFNITSPMEITSTKYNSEISFNNNSYETTPDITIRSNKVRLSKLKLYDNGPSKTIRITNNSSDVAIEKNDITSKLYGIMIEGDGQTGNNVSKIRISENNTTAHGNNIFVQQLDVSDVIINNNFVTSNNNDAIEVNVPNSTAKNIVISGNIAESKNLNPETAYGLTIGLAKPQNVVVMGNISKSASKRGLHIEDAQKNITVIGNIFDNNVEDGCMLLDKNNLHYPVIVNSNFFIKKDNAKTNSGIRRMYNSDGSLPCNIANNYIKGFDIGIDARGYGYVHADGIFVEDCNTAVLAEQNAIISGTIHAKNCPILVNAIGGAVVEKVISETAVTDIIVNPGTLPFGATVKNFSAITDPLSLVSITQGQFNLFKLPQKLDGDLIVIYYDAGQRFYLKLHVNYDGINLTTTLLFSDVSNFYSPSLVKNNEYLAIQITPQNNATGGVAKYDFNGTYYK